MNPSDERTTRNMSKFKTPTLAATAAVLGALAAAGCGDSAKQAASDAVSSVSSSVSTQVKQATDQAKEAAGGAIPSVLSVASPASGALQFNPTSLTSKPGSVTIIYANPSQVPHNLAILDSSGKEVGSTMEPFTAGVKKTTAKLAAGSYVYECLVPGHAQAGMKGTLTVS